MIQHPVFIIAEIAQAHDGSLGLLHSYIDALAATGVNAVKFQTHIAEAESSIYEEFRINFSYEDKTRFDYWKRMEFTKEQWLGIKKHCEELGLEFMSSPFSLAAVDLLEEIEIERFKIGSGEVTNFLMLEKIARLGKPIILSSGMSSFQELDAAVELLRTFGNDLTVLQCTTSYPTPQERVGLNVIKELKKRYPFAKSGLSDHSGKVFNCIAAAALGAEVLEFHAVFDKRMFGPDSKSSLTIDEIRILVQGVRDIEIALANPVDKDDLTFYTNLKTIFEKSLAVNKPLPIGHTITIHDLETKKPANKGIPASEYKSILGKELRRSLTQYEFLNQDDLEP